ncbi:MAG: glycosyl hydrolase-related protein [Prevotellaceae bacterium]|jgi:alpha-mannosidase|nr:glycosyl hydrolase-related protein [Prevotellaceae bacterium]
MKKIFVILIYMICMDISAQGPDILAQPKDTVTVDDETFNLMSDLSKSQLGKGEIHLFTTTHQDLGWIDHPEVCIILRDTVWLTPFFERMEREPDFRMDIEQTSILMEYLHRHPFRRHKIEQWLRDGRICVGATYIQPYEEMYSGESLARQFYLGKRWLKQEFDYTARSYFNVDVPGRTLQMPQLLARAGVENMLISRHGRGMFNWASPDGSTVRFYSSGHYDFFYKNILASPDSKAFNLLAKEAIIWYKDYNNISNTKSAMPAMLNYEFIWDQAPAQNCDPFAARWNAITHIRTKQGKTEPVRLPKFRRATADDFFDALKVSTTSLPTISGERPNVWLYIHGPSHERAITASRKGDIAITAAEKVASFNAMTDGDFTRYPASQLADAWKSKIYPDHGWGGKNGEITDNTFLRRFEHALAQSEEILETGIDRLASQVRTNQKDNSIPIVVFNTLSWRRNDIVTVDISLPRGYADKIDIFSAHGNNATFHLSEVSFHKDGSISTGKLYFIAENIPPFGYLTFYLKPCKYEYDRNAFYNKNLAQCGMTDILFDSGGIKSIYDMYLKQEILDTSAYFGGEIVTLRSRGNGAGEFDAVQQPDTSGFDRTSWNNLGWILEEGGDIYARYIYRSNIRNAIVEQKITVYFPIRKIDFDVEIRNWEGVLFREFRMMIPINVKSMDSSEIAYEVPYGVVRIGKDEMSGSAGERYLTPNKDIHPRGVGNWFGVSGDKFGVTLSTSVAAVDHIDPTGKTALPVIQPIIFASRRSCHGEGNEYLQYGDHSAHFSLTWHEAGWQNGHRFGTEANEKLLAVFNPTQFAGAKLPEEHSFFGIDSKNVVISAIKKCEDDESIVVRMYNLSGNEETVSLAPSVKPSAIIRLNLIEEEQEQVKEIKIGGYAIETFKLKFD